MGQTNYGAGVWAKFRDAVFDFAMKGSADFRSAVTPIIRWGVGEAEPSYHSMLFHNGPEDTPVSLANFTAPVFSTLNNSMSRRSMHQWTLESDAGFDHIHGLRQRFYVVSLYANKEAMDIVHNTWFTGVQKELSSVQNFFTGVAFMPIAKNYIIAGNKRGGDPMGVDSSKAPYIWVEESMMWSNPADDAKIDAFLKSVNKDIDSQLGPKGYQAPYLYLNDADKGQPVFQGYTKGSVQKLKAIRAKYDPKRAFTDLMPGGWKVDSV